MRSRGDIFHPTTGRAFQTRATRVEVRQSYQAVSELGRLRELEQENARLRRMYAELALENTTIKDVLDRKL